MYSFPLSFNLKKIRDICGTQAVFAQKLGISSDSMAKRLSNKVPFTHMEIEKTLQLLEIDWRELSQYFFQEMFTN
ncbi:MAG: DUF739 family protein [Chitinispirillales bacterium]|jgi:hypothetical protein|nr:DUF739 family protein [Chitinispirillales bacterium]